MRYLIVFLFMFFVSPALAEENRWINFLNSLPPMEPTLRAKFDKAAASMYDPSCRCLVFLFKGKVSEFSLPLNDTDRRMLIDGVQRGAVIPLEQKKEKDS